MPKSKKIVSQKTIADKLGISQALVSYILGGRRHNIAEETIQKVLNCAFEMGYSSKLFNPPRHTNSNFSGDIALFFRKGVDIASDSNFFGPIQYWLLNNIQELGGRVVLLGSEDLHTVKQLKVRLKKEKPEAMIVLGEVEGKWLKMFSDLNLTTLNLSGRSPGLCHSINANLYTSAQMLASHLVGLNCKKFLCFGEGDQLYRGEVRLDLFKRTLMELGVKTSAIDIINTKSSSVEDGFKFAQKHYTKSARKTGWMATTGTLGRGACQYLQKRGIKFGKNFNLVVMDDTPICKSEAPHLTSAFASPKDLAQQACELLSIQINQQPPRLEDWLVEPTFTKGESS